MIWRPSWRALWGGSIIADMSRVDTGTISRAEEGVAVD